MGTNQLHFTEADAIEAAHSAGFAGTAWVMGPEELAHLLNILFKPKTEIENDRNHT